MTISSGKFIRILLESNILWLVQIDIDFEFFMLEFSYSNQEWLRVNWLFRFTTVVYSSNQKTIVQTYCS